MNLNAESSELARVDQQRYNKMLTRTNPNRGEAASDSTIDSRKWKMIPPRAKRKTTVVVNIGLQMAKKQMAAQGITKYLEQEENMTERKRKMQEMLKSDSIKQGIATSIDLECNILQERFQ